MPTNPTIRKPLFAASVKGEAVPGACVPFSPLLSGAEFLVFHQATAQRSIVPSLLLPSCSDSCVPFPCVAADVQGNTPGAGARLRVRVLDPPVIIVKKTKKKKNRQKIYKKKKYLF